MLPRMWAAVRQNICLLPNGNIVPRVGDVLDEGRRSPKPQIRNALDEAE